MEGEKGGVPRSEQTAQELFLGLAQLHHHPFTIPLVLEAPSNCQEEWSVNKPRDIKPSALTN